MAFSSLSHVPDGTLLRELADTVSQDRTTTARMLAQLAEVDQRRLYLPAGYSSMFLYCLHELHMSEDVAYKRIRAARSARQFPAILAAVAGGRLHLAAVVLLTPHLTPETAGELLAAAEHKTKAEMSCFLHSASRSRTCPRCCGPSDLPRRPANCPRRLSRRLHRNWPRGQLSRLWPRIHRLRCCHFRQHP